MIKALGFGVLVLPFVVGFYFANYTERGCAWRKGQWHESAQYCIALDCREKENCGKRSNPQAFCSQLSVGDNLDKAYFYLGEPSRIQGETYRWQTVDSQNQGVEIRVVKQTIKHIACEVSFK